MSLSVGSSYKLTTNTGTVQITSVNVSAGDSIAVGMRWGAGANFTSLVDSAGNTYSLQNSELTTGGFDDRLYVCANASAISSGSITLTIDSAVSASMVVAVVHSSTGTTAIDAAQVQGTDASSPFDAPAYTTTVADTLLISTISSDSGSNPATLAESSGFTILQDELNGAANWTGGIAWRAAASVTSYTASWTSSGGANTAVRTVGFKEVAASGGLPLIGNGLIGGLLLGGLAK